MAETHVVLEQSERPLKRNAERIGDVDGEAPVEVTVTLRRPALPEAGEPISREEFEHKYATSPYDIDTVKGALEGFGMAVQHTSPAASSLIVSGNAAQMKEAFHTRLGTYRSADEGVFRGREGQVKVPSELRELVTGVFGLDQRRVARRRAREPTAPKASGGLAEPLGPGDLETRYRFPPGDGAGQTIAIAEFGGGYFPDDVREFCETHGRGVPHVTTVAIGPAPPTPDDIRALPAQERDQALGESLEVVMDVEIVAGMCPSAEICVLFANYDQKGWVDLLDRVIAAQPTPVALCVSWGWAEDAPDWSLAALNAINERLHAASLRGITVCAATGDDGSGYQAADGSVHVNFPASSPFVLAVGGTMLDGEKEVVWCESPGNQGQPGAGATGGGVSNRFKRPQWQDAVIPSLNPGSIDGRLIPDVAALAGLPGYSLVFGGQTIRNGGTSAAAPLWAALIARIAGQTPALAPRFLPPLLYQAGADGRVRGESAFIDIPQGSNAWPPPGRGYQAQAGYDAVSGWGVPDGQALMASLQEPARLTVERPGVIRRG